MGGLVDAVSRKQNARRISPSDVSHHGRNNSKNLRNLQVFGYLVRYTFSRPHHSAMNRAVDWVILRIDSMFTRSSKPCTSSDCGP
jgi:hypothetical protein